MVGWIGRQSTASVNGCSSGTGRYLGGIQQEQKHQLPGSKGHHGAHFEIHHANDTELTSVAANEPHPIQ